MKWGLCLGLTILLTTAAYAVASEAERVRPAAVAGSWYPGEPGELADYLDGLLDAKSRQPEDQAQPVRALISPHAGYVYSGAAAADGFRLVKGQTYRRVIVLGPAHRGWFRGMSIADVTHYETPLGRIPLDLEAVAGLRASDLVSVQADAHTQEHSIEMQLPLLQRALPSGWTLVPVLVGDMGDSDYAQAANLLKPLMDKETLVVVSSDFAHYGPRFGYFPFPHDEHTAAQLEELDRGALARILEKDAEGFLAYQQETGTTICGFRPIAILLRMLPDEVTGALRTYATSGELTGDYRDSVSYMSIVFRDAPRTSDAQAATEESPPSALLPEQVSERDLEHLHTLAATAVEAAVRREDSEPLERLQELLDGTPSHLKSPSGAFVTLRRNDRLRGCIGYYLPLVALDRAVVTNAVSAALRDPRFPPLQEQELQDLEIEVSVLTPPRSIESPEAFRVGEQGIILEKDGHSAVYLPEVAQDMGWSRENTLTSLAEKAGLEGDAWKNGAQLKVFDSRKYAASFEDGKANTSFEGLGKMRRDIRSIGIKSPIATGP